MGAFYFHNQVVVNTLVCGEGDVWENKPTLTGTILYSLVVPLICLIGIKGNTVSFAVFKRKELSASVYTYLTVLAASDFCASLYLFLFGLSNGVLYDDGWNMYDATIGIPVGGFISCVSVLNISAVTVDRVLYLWDPLRVSKPKFCNPSVAKKVVCVNLIFSAIVNLPYCFIFKTDSDKDQIVTTDFFDSEYYIAYNWVRLTFFGIIPLLILILGNGFLIAAYRKAMKFFDSCLLNKNKCKAQLECAKFTITLVLTVVLFLISVIPMQIISRSTVISIVFDGNHKKIDSKGLEIAREIFTVITALSVSVNFFIYYLLCPSFSCMLKKMIQRKKQHRKEMKEQKDQSLSNRKQKQQEKESFEVNVFVIKGVNTGDNIDYFIQNNLIQIVTTAANARKKSMHCIDYAIVKDDCKQLSRLDTSPLKS